MISHRTIATVLFASALAAGGIASGEGKKPSVGEKVKTPIGNVKVDKSAFGHTTVRTDSKVGPSVTTRSEPRTPSNPKGASEVSVGITIETD